MIAIHMVVLEEEIDNTRVICMARRLMVKSTNVEKMTKSLKEHRLQNGTNKKASSKDDGDTSSTNGGNGKDVGSTTSKAF